MSDLLTSEELALWHAWKLSHERVKAQVVEDVARVTGMSDGDFVILLRVSGAGGRVRQNQLATALEWHRSRLSHQLTRMEGRGLVTRTGVDGGVEVSLTDAGQALFEKTRPVHAAAVRHRFIDRLTPEERAGILEIATRLREEPDACAERA
jgi:DNA-binding MarR family transcriptional regulator